ncbi:MAG TPA: C10 family peptidase [Bacteroidales bacterium]|nr:C10 family peptidase [Bacteroidales bacterium]HNS47661.1 C10 family peptidase [Bacteroidales bacterium]
MKRFLCWIIPGILLFADTLNAHTVDSAAVLTVAQHFYYEYTALAKNSSLESVTPRIHSVKRNRELKPLLYFVNIETGGFLIIAGDTRAYPILAHNEYETWTDDRMEKIAPAARSLILSYADQIEMIIDLELPEDEMTLQLWYTYQNGPGRVQRDYPLSELPGMESMHWNQNMYYNHLCPNTGGIHPPSDEGFDNRVPTGCVAVAMAQIMNYWDWPTSTLGFTGYWDPDNAGRSGCQLADPSYGYLSFGFSSYDFSNMPDELNDFDHDDVALLISHAGQAAKTDYVYCSSGSNINKALDALVNIFKFASVADIKEKDWYESWMHWEGLMVNEIDCGRPFYYRGTRDNGSGHAFVGYAYRYIDSFFQFKFNWGWGGYDNPTWYTIRSVAGYELINYHNDQMMITELYPICLNCPFWNYHIYPTTSWQTHLSSTQWYGCMVYKVNVIDGTSVTLVAGSQIFLKPGFHAQNGSYFHAYISEEGCSEPLNPVTIISAMDDQANGGDTLSEYILGTEHPASERSVIIYPKPTNGLVNVGVQPLDPGRKFMILLYDLRGRILFRQEMMSPGKTELNLSSFPRGMYIMKMNIGEKTKTVKVLKYP